MRCHYDVLSVERDATDDEIKKSYRKLALKLHPDKNPDNPEVVEQFREVQSAYDVLMDAQERAWYDKHREAILKGGEDYVDDAMDLMHYFNPSVYSGFDDGPKSFYSVFREAFLCLSREEEAHLDGEAEVAPEFGFSYSDYDSEVKPFYVYWLAYRTNRSYVWKSVYDVRTAANRPTQRLMEKENKKLRESCRKKRNEEVRALVMYVRKRDKRVQAEMARMKAQQEETARKTKEIQEAQKLERSKMLENYTEAEWMMFDDSKLDDIDSQFNEMFGRVTCAGGDSEDSEEEDYLYCIACDKNFKSDKALANHEKSKKHKENVMLIKNELDQLEGDLFEEAPADDTELPGGQRYQSTDADSDPDCDGELLNETEMQSKSNKNKDLPTPAPSGKRSKKKKKKKKNRGFIDSDEELNNSDDASQEVEETKAVNGCGNDEVQCEDIQDDTVNLEGCKTDENEEVDVNENENYNCNNSADKEVCEEPECIPNGDNDKSDNNSATSCGISPPSTNTTASTKKKNKQVNNIDDCEETGSWGCEVCPKIFPTRNKLFKHIKSEGHAVLKEGGNTKKSKKGKGKR